MRSPIRTCLCLYALTRPFRKSVHALGFQLNRFDAFQKNLTRHKLPCPSIVWETLVDAHSSLSCRLPCQSPLLCPSPSHPTLSHPSHPFPSHPIYTIPSHQFDPDKTGSVGQSTDRGGVARNGAGVGQIVGFLFRGLLNTPCPCVPLDRGRSRARVRVRFSEAHDAGSSCITIRIYCHSCLAIP